MSDETKSFASRARRWRGQLVQIAAIVLLVLVAKGAGTHAVLSQILVKIVIRHMGVSQIMALDFAALYKHRVVAFHQAAEHGRTSRKKRHTPMDGYHHEDRKRGREEGGAAC